VTLTVQKTANGGVQRVKIALKGEWAQRAINIARNAQNAA
jgi:hypothetical protein